MTFLIILLVLSFLIALLNIGLLVVFPNFTKSKSNSSIYLNISIIIAFRNEEKNLDDLFSALEMLNYPIDKYEVILIDDNSSDSSYQKAAELSSTKSNYRVSKAANKKYPGKKGALDFGISNANYSYILITDADCKPAQNWLLGYSEKFNNNYDMIFGFAPFIQTNGIINKISCYENLRNSLLTVSLAELKLPYSAAARNFGFTISAFKRLGGFANTLETPSGDDDLLIREAVKNKLKIGVVDSVESYVLSNSKNTIGEYLDQKARHTKTSFYYLPLHKFLIGFWHSSNILVLFSFLLLPNNIFFVLPFLIKLLTDSIVVVNTQRKLRYNFKFYEIPFLQFVYEFFLIVNFFSSFRKNITWQKNN
jgi:cellulose synthase/poly-beta-1,6-N-acetylglucosamine synthase-like glycosyltransferase